MAIKIASSALTLKALRDSGGYRQTGNAVAELVDNGIQAGAKNIHIVANATTEFVSQRRSTRVKEVAVFDDGEGMDEDTLARCLQFGYGTRLDAQTGIGKFGFGLKGSSLSQARRVEVYSWQKKGQVNRAYLDFDEIIENDLEDLPEVEPAEIPEPYASALANRNAKSGTLVVWQHCDRLSMSRAATLLRQMNHDLCRIYRHFLDDDETYGPRVHISMVEVEDGNPSKPIELRANDPLYLLTPNNLPEGYNGEATNSLFEDPIPLEFETSNGKKSVIEFRFTIAKPETQNLGGGSPVGRHYRANTGISIVRACREIDIGEFGFYNPQDERQRWWGCEIRFEPVLDEVFGVDANKQRARNVQCLDAEELKLLIEEGEEITDVARLNRELTNLVRAKIGEMFKVITARHEGSRRQEPGVGPSSLPDKVSEDLKKDSTPTQSEEEAQDKKAEDKLQERKTLLQRSMPGLTDEEAEEAAKSSLDLLVDLQFDGWPGSMFLSRKIAGNGSVGIINRETKFYEVFWEFLHEGEDTKGAIALETIILAFVRTEDELAKQYGAEQFEKFRERWGHWVQELIKYAES